MDINDLKNTVANLSLYDLKAGFRKAQNAVMNYTEMEAKVREATNNEPWGASSTLMQEIANATFNYSTLNEIMPMIYRRFTEKAAEEWRQIYKALQLLEFLIKHGSERVIDDARSHIALLKMLRQFHFIDPNGKDQGINVRNRAKELAELLGDVERIRSERKKARSSKNKYTGVEGGAFSGGGGGFSGSSSRYGGFGSEDAGGYGGYSGGVYGDGGGFGGQQGEWQDSSASRSERFEEYDEFDEGERRTRTSKRPERTERAGTKKTTPTAPPKKKEPEVDLFSFDEPAQSSAPSAAPSASHGSGFGDFSSGAPAANEDDDEFDDFQSATPVPQSAQSLGPLSPPVTSAASSTTQFAAPQPLSAPPSGLSQMVNMTSPTGTPAPNYSSFSSAPPPQPAQFAQPISHQSSGPNYFGGVQVQQSTGGVASGSSAFSGFSSSSTPSTMANTKPVTSSQPKPAGAGGDAFGALWGKASSGIKKTNTPGSGPAMGQLAKEKSSAGIWGAPASSSSAPPTGYGAQPGGGSASNDLLG